jgi:hypothetical protein
MKQIAADLCHGGDASQCAMYAENQQTNNIAALYQEERRAYDGI